jgi:hypothetical protein
LVFLGILRGVKAGAKMLAVAAAVAALAGVWSLRGRAMEH